MKTTVDIPEEELREAIRHTGARTKRAAVLTAVAEFNRHRRLAKLVKRFGTFEHFVSPDELRRLRDES